MTRPGPPVPPRPGHGPGGPTPPFPRPRPATRRGIRLQPPVIIGLVFALVVGGAAVGIGVLFLSGRAVAAEVLTEPVNTAGANPFAPPIGTDHGGITPVASSGGRFDPATTPGLYGGTRNQRSCDPAAMVAFLDANPDKARAWSGVLGITPAQIPAYVSGLTPVILRSDTYVTNHGFRDGDATTLLSVLQAGTAVLVDRYGTPRVKCYCGNPLTPAVVPASPRYVGPAWPGFSTTNITIINESTTVINELTLVDPATGAGFVRPTGSLGEGDRDSGSPPSTTTAADPTSRPPAATTAPPVTTRPPARDVDITGQGSVAASSTYRTGQFPASSAVDGDLTTSWFSAGPGSDGTSVYVWQAPGDTMITGVRVESNGRHAEPSVRSGFGFGGVTVEVLDSAGRVVFTEGGTLPGSPDPAIDLAPNVTGSMVRLTYSGHEDETCGGFAELTVIGSG